MENKLKHELELDELLQLVIDNSFGTIFSAKGLNGEIEVIYNSLEAIGLHEVKTISDIIKKVDKKSEITEILGVDEFFANINKTIEERTNSKVYLPLRVSNETKVYSFRALKKANGIILCYLQLIDDETLDIERLFSDSYKDSLTYLFNKNALDFHLKKNVGYHYIGFMDLDNFKYINDTYSHHSGNQLLTEIGKKLITVSDNHVIYYRYGGDEFVFITIDMNYLETIALANRIQLAVSSITFLDVKPTFSIGISEYVEESNYSIEDAVKLADYAMYRSKYNGKNKISYIDCKDGNEIIKEEKLDDVLRKLRKAL